MCLPKGPKYHPVTQGTQQNIIEQAPTDDVAKPADTPAAIDDGDRTRTRKGISSLRMIAKGAASGLMIPKG